MKIRNVLVAMFAFCSLGAAQAACEWGPVVTRLWVDGQGRSAQELICNTYTHTGEYRWVAPPPPPVAPPVQEIYYVQPAVVWVPQQAVQVPPPSPWLPYEDPRVGHRPHRPHGYIEFDSRNVSVRIPIGR